MFRKDFTAYLNSVIRISVSLRSRQHKYIGNSMLFNYMPYYLLESRCVFKINITTAFPAGTYTDYRHPVLMRLITYRLWNCFVIKRFIPYHNSINNIVVHKVKNLVPSPSLLSTRMSP